MLSAIGGAAMIVAWLSWRFCRSKKAMIDWAKTQGITILNADFRLILRGPFTWTAGRSMAAFYRCRVMLPDGQTTHGWAKVGNDWIGLLGAPTVTFIADRQNDR